MVVDGFGWQEVFWIEVWCSKHCEWIECCTVVDGRREKNERDTIMQGNKNMFIFKRFESQFKFSIPGRTARFKGEQTPFEVSFFMCLIY